MARPLRLNDAGGVYRVTAQGNEGKAVVRDDRDRARFLDKPQQHRQAGPKGNQSVSGAYLVPNQRTATRDRTYRSGPWCQGGAKRTHYEATPRPPRLTPDPPLSAGLDHLGAGHLGIP